MPQPSPVRPVIVIQPGAGRIGVDRLAGLFENVCSRPRSAEIEGCEETQRDRFQGKRWRGGWRSPGP